MMNQSLQSRRGGLAAVSQNDVVESEKPITLTLLESMDHLGKIQPRSRIPVVVSSAGLESQGVPAGELQRQRCAKCHLPSPGQYLSLPERGFLTAEMLFVYREQLQRR